ncbi:arginine catabolic regulator [Liquorilactobacillus aquaticus DSM 21051]|uniref:Arginine repressor n=1 Tax=Liquorilactobacillus aquaticus DSM 21051 TaxID=1423725 RepID=A0A0R2CX31_9LACO|nr:arginine repressor [Liquorilactobacillus aquaticus]KRM96429.1 arginine catabolic regulator [Liquorilactobacillus aquaticus DSM 21051]
MRKQERQKAIKTLIQQNSIDRQEDIVKLLRERGIDVTQATISRDIKEMQLIKLPSLDGNYQYSMPTEKKMDAEKKLRHTLRDAYVSSKIQNEFFLIKVLPGNGPAVASLIDQLKLEQIFGTIGDDDTVLVIAASNEKTHEVRKILIDMAE